MQSTMVKTPTEATVNHSPETLLSGSLSLLALTDMVTMAIRNSHNRSKRNGFRSMLLKTLSPRITDWADQTLFFRHRINGITQRDAFDELLEAQNRSINTILGYKIEFYPTIVLKETHWYKIIRYCLYALNQLDAPSVVFTNPSIANCIDLFTLSFEPFLDQESSKIKLRTLHQMIAMQIALWLQKPAYLHFRTNRNEVLYASTQIQQRYIAASLYDALYAHQPENVPSLVDVLTNSYGIETNYKFRKNFPLFIRFRLSGVSLWQAAGDFSLTIADIWAWLDFNRYFKNTPTRSRVLTGLRLFDEIV
ncbi:hypothetical protein WBJ53_10825 [Spirosoma sp. SC4-14]|uniref:hypothetical protein n=1 Tax=Spirosoma sp. SC4-14 TaxID=3128900 RepID=UPI0030CFC725